MMPKGVEHLKRMAEAIVDEQVRIPMMPKGVEHATKKRAKKKSGSKVRIPMMPKGVEHIHRVTDKLGTEGCENSDDAERR